MSTRKAATVGDVAFLEEGPRVLSVYEGFFSGGARALHNAAVRSLDATTPQRHSVLSLSDRSIRESTTQAARDDAGYRRLVAAGSRSGCCTGSPRSRCDRATGQPSSRPCWVLTSSSPSRSSH